MYLKRLELVGFKSFAERTKLDFEPGLMAIVGPNGCGKSNVSDAIRWVLGEQSAKALRGGKMEDVIFNGTDKQKAMGMAEVSMTLSDCESSLGTEYNEVTVTRRVFRSGEGQYLINKAPCRLKDIQRLFMDTGVGTNSYSVMEQGRIDRVLSSRPEDRRAVFEEASGITKFKADKKEALRKLEHTESNLLRLADIIREVKRQIVSLQRQAGKARRYKDMHDRLRRLDLFYAREKTDQLDREISKTEGRRRSLAEREEAMAEEVGQADRQTSALRAELGAIEQEMTETMEHVVQARSEFERTQEAIRLNEDRMREFKALTDRDSRDVAEAQQKREEHLATIAGFEKEYEAAAGKKTAAEKDLFEKTRRLKGYEEAIEAASRLRYTLQNELIDQDRRAAQLQNELSEMEARDRQTVLRRERLAAEQAELQRTLDQFAARRGQMEERMEALRGEVERRAAELNEWLDRRKDESRAIAEIKQELSGWQSDGAARRARIEMLQRSDAEAEGFSGGARLLLDAQREPSFDRTGVRGSLAECLQAPPAYRTALEAVLRPWLDAVVLDDPSRGPALLAALEQRKAGAARLLAVDRDAEPPAVSSPVGESLRALVTCPEELAPLADFLLGRVWVLDSLEALPSPVPADLVYVTRGGALVGGRRIFEYWMPESQESNPIARRQLLRQWQDELAEIEVRLASGRETLAARQADETTFQQRMDEGRQGLEEARAELARHEGEHRMVAREAQQAQQRVETVAFELKALVDRGAGAQERKQTIHTEIDAIRARQNEVRATLTAKVDEQREAEQQRNQWMAEVTDARVLCAGQQREAEHLAQRLDSMRERVLELERLIRDRTGGITSNQSRLEDLHRATAAARDNLEPLQDEVALYQERLEKIKTHRDEKNLAVNGLDREMHEKRAQLDSVRAEKGRLDVELAQQQMRRQNLIERVTGEYRIAADAVKEAPEPDWGQEEAPSDRDALEAFIAELRAKIDAIGPVNLVAIEEHQELEERYNFLMQQQDDLVRSKDQLMEMIKRINQTTTQMFVETFEQVNTHFADMFTRLFGGGSAKLVLVDDQDVLESGIEIIARPPGKKLQSVSLLSGGERTMTAVALLFALFVVKPSPFCLMDELDAALDDTNIGRFVQVVQHFLQNSQFIVITHNRQTIAAANALYGVTMEKHGISKIVSVKFNPKDHSAIMIESPRAEGHAAPAEAAVVAET